VPFFTEIEKTSLKLIEKSTKGTQITKVMMNKKGKTRDVILPDLKI
jgi:hypothetical protein